MVALVASAERPRLMLVLMKKKLLNDAFNLLYQYVMLYVSQIQVQLMIQLQ